MTQNTSSLSSHQYDGIQVQSFRKRRHNHRTSKVTPSHESSKRFQQDKSQSNDETIEHSEGQFSTHRPSDPPTNQNKYEELKHKNQLETCNPRWTYILKILYGILGILLLTALILPSIFIYLLMPKSTNSVTQTGLSEQLSIYTNHCAGISPKSLWVLNTTTTITMHLNTSQCNFTETPLYFVSVGGSSSHICLTGYGAIYQPTNESFQIFTASVCGSSAASLLSSAGPNGWDVNWVGFYK